MNAIYQWLTEDSCPAVKYRTETELLGKNANRDAVIKQLTEYLPANWTETKGLWFCYYFYAYAECGLHADDLPAAAIDRAFSMTTAADTLDPGCATFLLLTAFVKLGLLRDTRMHPIMEQLKEITLPDGGYVCTRIRSKHAAVPKSCYKACLHALLFLAAGVKQGMDIEPFQPLIQYFLDRRIFYRHDAPDTLVLNGRVGWRAIDTFYPNEPMRVGIQNIIEAFCALGYGEDARLKEGWQYLYANRDADGKYLLGGTLQKSYLPKPKEKAGTPSKWVTFYAMLAERECNVKLAEKEYNAMLTEKER